jgi:hypothetical protein
VLPGDEIPGADALVGGGRRVRSGPEQQGDAPIAGHADPLVVAEQVTEHAEPVANARLGGAQVQGVS